MSKSKGNVIAPEDMIAEYGADAVRAYILFMAPADKELLWNEDGLAGLYKFLNRAWRQINDLAGMADDSTLYQADAKQVGDEAAGQALVKKLVRERHRVVEKVQDDFERNNFNTAISAIMELSNAAGDYLRHYSAEERAARSELAVLDTEVAEVLVKLLAPIAPHWAEELWQTVLGHDSFLYEQPWPTFDPEKIKEDEVELAVQINGKVKARITVAANADEDAIKTVALDAVAQQTEGKNIVKTIVIPGRLVNIVVK